MNINEFYKISEHYLKIGIILVIDGIMLLKT